MIYHKGALCLLLVLCLVSARGLRAQTDQLRHYSEADGLPITAIFPRLAGFLLDLPDQTGL